MNQPLILSCLAATLSLPIKTSADWTAFNDQGPVGNPNDTSYTIPALGTSSGPLRNITGGSLPASLTITTGGTGTASVGAPTMSAPSSGTPAYNIFNAYIDWTTGPNPGVHLYAGNIIDYRFSGLDPNKHYRFTGTATRGGTTPTSGNEYSNRWTQAELVGAAAYTPAHTSHVLTSAQYPAALTGSQAAWNAGVNFSGDVVEWDDIVPAFDGTFTVRCTKYAGPIPGGSAANSQYTYGFQAFRLEEFIVAGPLVQITNPVNNALIILPANLVVSAAVSGFPGNVTNVAFYNWPAKLADIASPPFNFTWSTVTPGSYTLRTIASDDTGLMRTSAPVAITVQSNLPPAVAITSPLDSALFTAPADIPINVLASDPDGQVTNVSFFANGAKIGENSNPPFNFLWANVPADVYDLTAVATDDRGASTTSAAVRVFAIVSTAPTIASFSPAPGLLSNFTQVTVTFSEPVDGVNATDLLINSLPANAVTGSNDIYMLSFMPPLEGGVTLTWAPNHGIVDRETPPKPFDGTRTNEIAQYTLIDTIPPVVASIYPPPGTTVPTLTGLDVTFSEPVTGVDAAALRINGAPATRVSGSLAGPYHFDFPQPGPGLVQITWATGQSIHDFAAARNPFVGAGWSYLLDITHAETKVLISEIMFHPVTDRTNDQFIELHNLGTSAVNLLGWSFTKGIPFTFPNVTIPAQGYLVVAADLAAFNARYPGVTNVIGSWSGWMTGHLELSDAAGTVINSVKYGTQGDWGTRIRGAAQDKVLSLTRNGSAATVTFLGNYDNGDTFTISGADQPEYNGTFTMSGVVNPAPRGCVSFNYTVPGTPATPATGTIVCRQISDCGHTGWAWSSPADGLGRSLELVNENLPNRYGQNWQPSVMVGGTPGQLNSVATNNAAPLILDALHFPLVPASTNSVTVTARILDEQTNNLTATLYWRLDAVPANPFNALPMFDDGLHGDGQAGDGVFGAIIPAQANNALIEFYLQATDGQGNSRSWPAPALETNNVPVQAANALYQVDNSAPSSPSSQPMFRLILREADRAELASFPTASPWSNCKLNLTVISIDGVDSQVRYLCGVRDRGAGTRMRSPCNHEISFPDDQSWHGVNSINLNTQFTESQLMGYVLAMLGGLDTEAARIVQVRVNNVNRASAGSPQFGSYVELERTDNNYVKNHWPGETGNIYRGQSWAHACNLAYHNNPTNFLDYAIDGYSKQNHTIDNDWSDLINLCRVLSVTNVSDDLYEENVRQVVDLDQWMTYFAVFNLSASLETAFATGVGDDYSLYRRSRDNRWVLMAHDWDTIMGEGDTSGQWNMPIFIMCPSVPFSTFARDTYVLERFMKHPKFAPIYYRELKRLCDTIFAPAKMNPTLDRWLGNWIPTATINNMKLFNSNRWYYVSSQIPLKLTASSGLSQSGNYWYTTTANLTLNGSANAVETRSVLVNGQPATWTAWLATWTNTITLNPGINRVVVQALNTNSVEFDRQTLDIWYNRGGETVVPAGTLLGTTTWSPAAGPYHVTGNLTINAGALLSIQPGTTVYFDAGVGLTVSGQLLAQGAPGQRIRFTRVPGAGAYWAGFSFNNARLPNVLAYADFEYAGSAAQAIYIQNSQVSIDRMTFFNNNPSSKWFDIWQPQLTIRHSVFGDLGNQYFCTAENMLPDGWFIIDGNLFGKDTGDNDIFHLNRISVKGGAAAMVLNNVFTGAGDDIVDDNETDTHIEGNLIMHANEGSSGNHGASAGVTTGPGGTLGVPNMLSQHLTVVRNVFYKNDYAIISKTGAYSQIYNNVFIGNRGAIMFDETDRPDAGPGRQSYIESCIFWGNKPDDGLTNGVLIDLVDPRAFDTGRLSRGQPQVTVNNSILPASYHHLGINNLDLDPLFVFPTNAFDLSPTNAAFTTGFDGFDSCPYLLAAGGSPDVHLQPNSPALRAGFNGVDMGAYVSTNASISGEPLSPTSQTDVTLTVGGTDLYAYKYRVLGPGFSPAWSAELQVMQPVYQILISGVTATATVTNHGYANGDLIQVLGADALTPYLNGQFIIGNVTPDTFSYTVAPGTNAVINQTAPRDLWCVKPEPIQLTGLASGTYQVQVLRKNSQNIWQNTATPTLSKSWTINNTWPDLQLNEVLVRNDSAVPVAGKFPSLVELYNRGALPLALSGVSLTDSADAPRKFVFPAGTHLDPGQYLVLYADNETTLPGFHLGFGLSQQGGNLYLFAATGQLLDSLSFGLQAPDLSVGRLADGAWALCRPTFGSANIAVQLGLPQNLRINEWLTSGANPLPFLELFNSDPRPVALGGLYLSDNLIGAPAQHQIATLSFIPGNGYAVFQPDANASAGPTHLNFSLSPARGEIALSDQDLRLIDYVLYTPQRTGVSQGRSPNGSAALVFFATPTPGSANPAQSPPGGQLVINEVLARNVSGLTNSHGTSVGWLELYNPTAQPITLSDLSLSDALTAPRIFVFPPGVTINSLGYLLVLCDASQPASSNAAPVLNTGFALKPNGGAVYLFDSLANGGAMLDGLAYGMQANDCSLGRVPDGGANWTLNLPTPGGLNIPTALGDPLQLRINEWMSNPKQGAHWFELYNPNAQPVNLSGLYLSDNLSTPANRQKFQIAPLSFIGSGLFGYVQFWADKTNMAAGPDHVNFGISSSGDSIGLTAPGDVLIDSITFGAQLKGVSQGRLPDGSPVIWSFLTTASPGDANYVLLTNIVINEVLTAPTTSPPTEQAIELFNQGSVPVDLSGWYLSDLKRALIKYRIPDGTVLPAGAFKVLYGFEFNSDLYGYPLIQLSAPFGGGLYLSMVNTNTGAFTGYRAEAAFGAAEPGVSFGRYSNSVGLVDFTALTRHTFGADNADSLQDFRLGGGAPNAYPVVGPVVFSEIMYRPPDFSNAVENVRDEFLKLENITTGTVPLYDPANPGNTWHLLGGVSFVFPPGVSLAPGATLLALSFDPVADTNALAQFRLSYPQLPANAALYGPYSGKLGNNGDTVELYRPTSPLPPGGPNAGFVPYILVDHIVYDQKLPWDPAANGTSNSLQRIFPRHYGNDPANWLAAAPLPDPNRDTDSDGIPDWWMQLYFGHPTGQAADNSLAWQDADADGFSNLQEFLAGTSPLDPASYLKIDSVQASGNSRTIRFTAVAGKTYSILFKDNLNDSTWLKLTDVPAQGISGSVTVTDSIAGAAPARFYRLVTPAESVN